MHTLRALLGSALTVFLLTTSPVLADGRYLSTERFLACRSIQGDRPTKAILAFIAQPQFGEKEIWWFSVRTMPPGPSGLKGGMETRVIYTNRHTGTWTAILSFSNGRSCMVATGNGLTRPFDESGPAPPFLRDAGMTN